MFMSTKLDELLINRPYKTVTVPNSMQVIPKDQMSTFPSYWPSSIAKITSGAILEYINAELLMNIL